MDDDQPCSVEGCIDMASVIYRFIDPNKPGDPGLGSGIVLQVPVCEPHGRLLARLSGEVTRWRRR
jgi:hypothetical protein